MSPSRRHLQKHTAETPSRQKRLAELNTISSASIYNQVYPLQKPDYSCDVTDVSKDSFVVVLLTSSQSTNIESQLLVEIWRELAPRFGDIKFCQIRGDLCIEGYPDKNTPTVLIYRYGDIKRQIVTLRELRGTQTTIGGTYVAFWYSILERLNLSGETHQNYHSLPSVLLRSWCSF